MTHSRNKRRYTGNNVDVRGTIALMTDCMSDKHTLHPFSQIWKHAFESRQKAMTHSRNKRKYTGNNVDVRGTIALMTNCMSDKHTLHPFSQI